MARLYLSDNVFYQQNHDVNAKLYVASDLVEDSPSHMDMDDRKKYVSNYELPCLLIENFNFFKRLIIKIMWTQIMKETLQLLNATKYRIIDTSKHLFLVFLHKWI